MLSLSDSFIFSFSTKSRSNVLNVGFRRSQETWTQCWRHVNVIDKWPVCLWAVYGFAEEEFQQLVDVAYINIKKLMSQHQLTQCTCKLIFYVNETSWKQQMVILLFNKKYSYCIWMRLPQGKQNFPVHRYHFINAIRAWFPSDLYHGFELPPLD